MGRMKKTSQLLVFICVIACLLAGCSSGGKDPFSKLSAATTRKEVNRKYSVRNYNENDSDDWTNNVSFLNYKGYMNFDYTGSDDSSHIREATWYFDDENDDSNKQDVLSSIYAYFSEKDGFTYDGSGTWSGQEWYKWYDEKGGTYTLYRMSSVFVIYEPMG